jgi:hypothetical protein
VTSSEHAISVSLSLGLLPVQSRPARCRGRARACIGGRDDGGRRQRGPGDDRVFVAATDARVRVEEIEIDGQVLAAVDVLDPGTRSEVISDAKWRNTTSFGSRAAVRSHCGRRRMSYRFRRLAIRALPGPVKRGLLSGLDLGYGALANTRSRLGLPGRLPQFLIIGAQRCGTTHIYDVLTAHPDVAAASHKEIHFFDLHYRRGPRWYQGNFAAVSQRGRAREPICGEATPTYIAYRQIPGLVHDLLPDVRLLVLLRNPVDRAISHYHHFVRLGYERRRFADAIAWEYEHLAGGNDPLLLDSPERRGDPLYLSHGAYACQLRFWFERFPREQILIVQSEELFGAPEGVLGLVAEFLGLTPSFRPGDHQPKQFSYTSMDRGDRERLRALYEPMNRDLEALIGRSFGWDV